MTAGDDNQYNSVVVKQGPPVGWRMAEMKAHSRSRFHDSMRPRQEPCLVFDKVAMPKCHEREGEQYIEQARRSLKGNPSCQHLLSTRSRRVTSTRSSTQIRERIQEHSTVRQSHCSPVVVDLMLLPSFIGGVDNPNCAEGIINASANRIINTSIDFSGEIRIHRQNKKMPNAIYSKLSDETS